MSNNFRVVTVCNRIPQEPYYTLREFEKSLGDAPLTVLGTKKGEYLGLASKPKLLLDAIYKGLISEEYVIFCDCWDLVFTCHPEELFECYQAFSAPIVVSSERNCFPADLREQYDALPFTSSFRYLNSGMIVAETQALQIALESMELHNVPDDHFDPDLGRMVHPNDQFLWQQTFLKQPVRIELDYNQILCNTLHDVKIEDLDFSKGRIRLKETGVYPCSYHLNGGAKTGGLREPILNHLGL